MTLGELLHDLGDDEPVMRCDPVREGVWSGECRRSWAEAARWLSESQGGMWFPGQHGVTWVCGKQVGRLMTPAYIALVDECRRVALDLGVDMADSVGGVARNLLAWVGEGQYPYKGLLQAHQGRYCGYHDVTPGRWDHGIKWDVKSCYYSLLGRLPSIRCHQGPRGPVWHEMAADEWDRWRRVLDAVGGCKPLRNTLWGVMGGGVGQIPAYCRGRLIHKRSRLGPYRPAALTVGRAAYELCWIASHQVGSVLSHTDSVVSVDGSIPTVYEDCGLTLRVEAEGETEVFSSASARVGLWASYYHKRGSTYEQPQPRADLSPGLRCWRWLVA